MFYLKILLICASKAHCVVSLGLENRQVKYDAHDFIFVASCT